MTTSKITPKTTQTKYKDPTELILNAAEKFRPAVSLGSNADITDLLAVFTLFWHNRQQYAGNDEGCLFKSPDVVEWFHKVFSPILEHEHHEFFPINQLRSSFTTPVKMGYTLKRLQKSLGVTIQGTKNGRHIWKSPIVYSEQDKDVPEGAMTIEEARDLIKPLLQLSRDPPKTKAEASTDPGETEEDLDA